MKSLEVSRRRMLALVGASAAAIPSFAAAAPARRMDTAQDRADESTDASALIAPLVAGAALGRWVVQGTSSVRHGALTIALSDVGGEVFYLDVCARDNGIGAYAPPARSDRYDVFLSNHGKGAHPTVEEQGLAAMALAEILRTNENRIVALGFLTLRDRLERFPNEVVRGL